MKNYTSGIGKVFHDAHFLNALLSVLALYVFEEWLFNSPQGEYLKSTLIFQPGMGLLTIIISGILSFFFCFAFVWTALNSSRAFQWLYILLFGISSLVQYGFWKAVGRFLSTPDLQIASATPLNIWMGAGTLYFNWQFFLPLLGFIALLFTAGNKDKRHQNFRLFFQICLYALFLGTYAVATNISTLLGPSLSSFFGTITQFGVGSIAPPSRVAIDYSHPGEPRNNIILVIDESIRGDHLSINGYHRETTPFLDQLDATDRTFYNWGVAVAGGTCSYISNVLMITGVRPGVDEFHLSDRYPTVFQYAKAMGYRTYYMDVQTATLWNGLRGQDLVYIDSWHKVIEFEDGYDSDLRAADLVTQIVSTTTGNFIVLNKRGVHFLYESSYPPEEEVWGPIPANYRQQPSLVINAYDNGIRYNLENFFGRLLSDPSILDDTTILYTSDHGQTLFENGVDWLHCNHTPQEARVPLFMLGRNLPPVDENFHASHSNILPTILDLMNVPQAKRIYEYAPSLFSSTKDTPADYYFFNGNLTLIDYPDP